MLMHLSLIRPSSEHFTHTAHSSFYYITVHTTHNKYTRLCELSALRKAEMYKHQESSKGPSGYKQGPR